MNVINVLYSTRETEFICIKHCTVVTSDHDYKIMHIWDNRLKKTAKIIICHLQITTSCIVYTINNVKYCCRKLMTQKK